MDLRNYDAIVINTSGGKDSQAMMSFVSRIARLQGVSDRLVAVHSDLGRAEWKGVRELVEEQAEAFGMPLLVVKREKGDILDHVRERGMWPSSSCRYCTSDHKRDQIQKLIVQIGNEAKKRTGKDSVEILNCIGLRSAESSARAKRQPMEENKRGSSNTRRVTNCHPILSWTEEQVWDEIRNSGTRHHEAYDLGMPRLSCVFCIFAPKEALVVAGRANPELLNEYIQIEEEIDHTFRKDFSLKEVRSMIDSDENITVADWTM